MPVMKYNMATKIKGIRTTCNNVENYINTVLSEISNPHTVGPKPGESDCRTPSVRQAVVTWTEEEGVLTGKELSGWSSS